MPEVRVPQINITNTTLGVPYYNYSIMGPKTLFLFLRPYIRPLEFRICLYTKAFRNQGFEATGLGDSEFQNFGV